MLNPRKLVLGLVAAALQTSAFAVAAPTTNSYTCNVKKLSGELAGTINVTPGVETTGGAVEVAPAGAFAADPVKLQIYTADQVNEIMFFMTARPTATSEPTKWFYTGYVEAGANSLGFLYPSPYVDVSCYKATSN